MDFIPFNSFSSNRNKTASPQNFKSSQNYTPPSSGKKMPYSSPAMPAFGSPAVNFSFGAPAVQNSGFDTQNRTPSPGQYNNQQYSPRFRGNNMSPRGYNNTNHNFRNQHLSPYSQKDYYNKHGDNSRMSHDASNFKTPQQYSSVNRGRGNGRKSFSKQFGQTPRNYNQGGSLYIEDYYHTSMLEDPWCSLSPVLIKT